MEGKTEKKWRFVTPAAYEEKKAELPELCFATRQPISWFIEQQEKKDAAATAAAEEVKEEAETKV